MSDKEQKTYQRTDITKVQHGGPMRFIEVSYGKVGKELLSGSEVSKRQLHHKSYPKMSKIYGSHVLSISWPFTLLVLGAFSSIALF